MTEVVELTERARLVIEADPVPMDPRREEVICGTYTEPHWWAARREGTSPTHDFPGNIVEAVNRLRDPEHVERWARVFYGILIQKVGDTYWYCDQAKFHEIVGGEFSIERQADVIRAEVREYEHYENGDARIVCLQRLARFRRTTRKYVDLHQDMLEVWETVESVCVAYIDDVVYSVAQIAMDYFFPSMNRKEQTIVTAMLDEQMQRALS